jgi:chromosome partitioning protein
MILATTNSKGGVGKSTIAGSLAVWLFDRKLRVALIDADYQASSSGWIGTVEPGISVLRVTKPNQLIKQAMQLATEYEAVVIDGPGAADEINRAILLVADMALLPCGPSLLDVRAAADAVETLESARLVRKDGKPAARFVCNKVQNTKLSRELLDAANTFGIEVAKTALRYRTSYAEAVSKATVVTRMGTRAKEAAQELDQLFMEVFYGKTPINDE